MTIQCIYPLINQTLYCIGFVGFLLKLLLFQENFYLQIVGFVSNYVKLFGFHFDENFKHPYAAISVGDFYRRWHISLGRFFRDYVYIPLGGNRKYQLRNIMVVWLLTGIWHGASWNFALWGFYFGCLMIIEKLLDKYLSKTPRAIRHIYTLILIVFSRAIFYFTDLEKLKLFGSVTITTAHEAYSTLETQERIGCPVHKLSTFVSPEQYHMRAYKEKENLMIVSPDDHEMKSTVLRRFAAWDS